VSKDKFHILSKLLLYFWQIKQELFGYSGNYMRKLWYKEIDTKQAQQSSIL